MPMTPMPVLPQAVVLAVPAVYGSAARLCRSALSPADPYCVLPQQAAVLVVSVQTRIAASGRIGLWGGIDRGCAP